MGRMLHRSRRKLFPIVSAPLDGRIARKAGGRRRFDKNAFLFVQGSYKSFHAAVGHGEQTVEKIFHKPANKL
jgi:hypothetical protein